MSKKRPSTRRRVKSTTRRKTVKSRPAKRTPPRSAPTAPRERRIELKPIAALIGTTIERLKRIQQTPATERTIQRLEHCAAEFAAICDPANSDCGPNMDFPEP